MCVYIIAKLMSKWKKKINAFHPLEDFSILSLMELEMCRNECGRYKNVNLSYNLGLTLNAV